MHAAQGDLFSRRVLVVTPAVGIDSHRVGGTDDGVDRPNDRHGELREALHRLAIAQKIDGEDLHRTEKNVPDPWGSAETGRTVGDTKRIDNGEHIRVVEQKAWLHTDTGPEVNKASLSPGGLGRGQTVLIGRHCGGKQQKGGTDDGGAGTACSRCVKTQLDRITGCRPPPASQPPRQPLRH